MKNQKLPILPILDAGHAGIYIDPISKEDVYETAPKKMFTHRNDKVAFEGIYNRKIVNNLKNLLQLINYPYIYITDTPLDVSLAYRVNCANSIHEAYKLKFRPLYLSFHSNAGNGTGIELWTSKGQTESDKYASQWHYYLSKYFQDVKFRNDTYSDGDVDKEADFTVLKKTYCPSVLLEFLFFDNWDDFQLLENNEILMTAAKATFDFIFEG